MRLFKMLFNHQLYPPTIQAELLALSASSNKPYLSLLLAGLIVLVCSATLPVAATICWVAGAFVCMLLGYAFRHAYQNSHRVKMTARQIQQGEWAGVGYGLAIGCLWGSSSNLLVPGQTTHNLVITMIYLGVAAGASAITVSGLAHLLLASAVSICLFVRPFHVLFPEHWRWLTVIFFLYQFIIVQTCWSRHRMLGASLLLREEKDRLLEQERIEAARAQRANQEKSAFLAATSHDLRQPVHAVMLIGHALHMRLPEGENRDLVERILEAGQALSDQFNELMDLSRLEGGNYRLNIGSIALGSLLQRTVSAHQEVASDKGIALRLQIDRRLQQRLISTDSGLLRRILDNLLHNAIKFSSEAKVLVSARLRAGSICLSVYDQGAGIPADQLNNIFVPYVQLGNPTRDRSRGIGLGLSIVQQAATLLDSRISLRSQPGRGSCFSLLLPATAVLDSPLPTVMMAPVAESLAGTPASLAGRRLLLVEDDPMAAAALIVWASDRGLLVEHFSDPRLVSEDCAPDLILCDIRLPGERDGIVWLTDWLGRWPDARGLLVSGELAAEAQRRADQEGLLLLTKPVDPRVLLQTLTGLLR